MAFIRIDVLNTWNSFTMSDEEYEDYYIIISDIIEGSPYFSYKKYGFDKLSFSPENIRQEIESLLNNNPRMKNDFVHFVLNDCVRLGTLGD